MIKLKEIKEGIKKKSGVIPVFVENGVIQMLFFIPSDPAYGGNRFQIAKGHIKPGETPEESAVREATEELGLIRTNISKILGYTIQSVEGNLESYDLMIYSILVKDKSSFNKPHYETAKTKWLTFDEFKLHGRTSQIRLVTACYDDVKKNLQK